MMNRSLGKNSYFVFQGIAVLFFIMTWTMGFLYADVVKSVQISVDGVTGQEREAVQKAIEISNDLIKEEVMDEEWLKRLERQGPQRIREALEPFGYYKSDVTVKLEASDEGSYRFLVTVKTGEPVHIKAIQIIAQGPGTSEDTIKKMLDEFPLRKGERLRQDIYEEAKNNLLKKAISIGYLDAAYSKHSIRITLSKLSAEIDLILETGSKYYFGDVSFTDQTGFPDSFLTRYLAFKRGEVYSQEKIAQTQVNLISSDRFKMVTINGNKDEAKDNYVPVEIKLVPLKQKRVKFGIGYGTDTGIRGSIRYQDFNILGTGQFFDMELKLSEIYQGVGARYIFPGKIDVKSLASIKLGYEHEKTSDKTIEFLALEGALTRTFGKEDRAVGKEKLGSIYLRLQQEDSEAGNEKTRTFLVMPGVQFSHHQYDNVIRPTKGFRYNLELRGTDQSMGSETGFLQFLGRGEYLISLPQRFTILTRMQVGATTENEPAQDLPISVRFFAGGDTSVRGYKYQSLGPTDAFGDVIGGKHLLFGSVELERAIGKNWGIAAFYDTGNAFNAWSRIDLAQGAGIGGRYYTPIGPIRLDVARQIGVRKPDYRIHLVVGIGL
jgi:translocation and assembly module TamA